MLLDNDCSFIITDNHDTLRWAKIKSNDWDDLKVHQVGSLYLIEIDKRLASGWRNILRQYGCINFDVIDNQRGRTIINQGGL